MRQISLLVVDLFGILEKRLALVGRDRLENFMHTFANIFLYSQHAESLHALFALQVGPHHGSNLLQGFLFSWYWAE